MMDLIYLAFGLAVVIVGLGLANKWFVSPVLAIANRWGRWILFSVVTAYAFQYFHWSGRPFWALAVIAFLSWFLLESVYTWFAIGALSQSPIPLFPRFLVNDSGEEWPAQKRIIVLRDWLRRNRYSQRKALTSDVGNGIVLHVSIYQDPTNDIRVQILFIPQANGRVSVCFSLSSTTASGHRLVTDNLFLPFGGFYPENWSVDRRPCTRSLRRLLACHRRTIERSGEELVPWDDDPLDDLNLQQRDLERVNTEMGFLFPHALREEYGKMTWEGRYRVWTEVWMLNYIGRTHRY